MLAKKFIIQNGLLIMGEVESHFDLVEDHAGIVGGGRYHYYPELYGDALFFYGISFDYGSVSRNQFYDALEKSPLTGIYANSKIFFSNREWLPDAMKEQEAKEYIDNLIKESQRDNKS